VAVSLERLARNQVLFREVNERLREMLDYSARSVEFLCECSNTECIETVVLDVSEYERVRTKSNQFVIAPGHEPVEVERVTWESDRYFLVEKIEGARYAEQTDPRARGEG
jgi:hypothetical protein